MLRIISLVFLSLIFMPSISLADGILDPRIDSSIVLQNNSPIKLLECKSGYSVFTGRSYGHVSFQAVSATVRSVRVRFALLGLDSRVLDESSVVYLGKFSPGISISPGAGFSLGKTYPDGSGLCAVSAVEMMDGTQWFAQGSFFNNGSWVKTRSDHPWNPFDDIFWGDEPK